MLKESWTGELEWQEVVSSEVLDMRVRLQEMMEVVQVNVAEAAL